VHLPPDLTDQVAERLREAALGRLGLARKAGAAIAGFSQVETAIARGDLACVITASDAAEDGERKVGQALRRRFGGESQLPVLRLFTSEELSLALGRPNVIHAAVLQGPAGGSFMEAAIRLQRYLGVDDGQTRNQGPPCPQEKMNE
jgi:ribosomal protein L7Ae-like RNA K-turn-binding protein